MKTLAFIAAKLESIRFPRKNLAEFRGLPLVAHAMHVANEAKAVGLIDQVVLSYDDWQVKEAAQRGGKFVALQQQHVTRAAHPPVIEVLRSVLEDWRKDEMHATYGQRDLGELPDTVCVLWPTSPLRTLRHLCESFRRLNGVSGRADVVLSVVNVSREVRGACVMVNGDDQVGLARPELLRVKTEFYRHDGTVAWIRTEHVFAGGGFYDGVVRPYEIPAQESADIDYPLDLEWAEFLAGRKES